MDALSAAHDAAVQMIDTSIVRVHQHAACIASNKNQCIGRSHGGLTSKIHALVDTNVVIASCHTPALLDLVEEPVDQISSPIEIQLAANYLAFIQLASIRLWLRVNESAPGRLFTDTLV